MNFLKDLYFNFDVNIVLHSDSAKFTEFLDYYRELKRYIQFHDFKGLP